MGHVCCAYHININVLKLMNIEEAKYWMTRDLEQCLWGQILDLHRPNDMVVGFVGP